MSLRNQLGNAKNPFQGTSKKVLSVCSAGLLRSPTIAFILTQEPFNYNTRACGASSEYALIPLSEVLVYWADEVVVVEPWIKDIVLEFDPDKVVHVVPTPDEYNFRDPELVNILKPKLLEVFKDEY